MSKEIKGTVHAVHFIDADTTFIGIHVPAARVGDVVFGDDVVLTVPEGGTR